MLGQWLKESILPGVGSIDLRRFHTALCRHGRCFGTSWHGSWESYAFLAVQLHYDIAQGLENLMPETQHLETSDC